MRNSALYFPYFTPTVGLTLRFNQNKSYWTVSGEDATK